MIERKKGGAQGDPRCGKGNWGEKNERTRVCGGSNEIYCDGAMIQLSSRGFKRLLDGVP